MAVSVQGQRVVANFDGQELVYDAKDFNPELVNQAIANAVAARFSAIATASKEKDAETILGKIRATIEQWAQGSWARGGEPQWTTGDEKVLEIVAQIKGIDKETLRKHLDNRADELGLTLVTLIRKLKSDPAVQAALGNTVVDLSDI